MVSLPAPAVYTPWTKGVYDVAPGLKPFGTDFGNGDLDRKLFQFDGEFAKYRENKLRCILERPSKYLQRHGLEPSVEMKAVELVVGKLLEDWPDQFALDGNRLQCHLTGESIPLELDALALQIPEDIAVVCRVNGRDWIAYLNLCSPSHWAAEAKIGKSFFETHQPIPGFERVNSVAGAMVESMVNRGPFVRFVWGIESDDRLNHHPEPPVGEDPDVWHGRQFEKGWFLRTERQTTWGLPSVDAALFVIRVGFVTQTQIQRSPDLWNSLVSAVQSMSDEAQSYKGASDFLRLQRN